MNLSKGYIGLTDPDWYEFLSVKPKVDEVNFWQPHGTRRMIPMPARWPGGLPGRGAAPWGHSRASSRAGVSFKWNDDLRQLPTDTLPTKDKLGFFARFFFDPHDKFVMRFV
jgi:hypothetical protein